MEEKRRATPESCPTTTREETPREPVWNCGAGASDNERAHREGETQAVTKGWRDGLKLLVSEVMKRIENVGENQRRAFILFSACHQNRKSASATTDVIILYYKCHCVILLYSTVSNILSVFSAVQYCKTPSNGLIRA